MKPIHKPIVKLLAFAALFALVFTALAPAAVSACPQQIAIGGHVAAFSAPVALVQRPLIARQRSAIRATPFRPLIGPVQINRQRIVQPRAAIIQPAAIVQPFVFSQPVVQQQIVQYQQSAAFSLGASFSYGGATPAAIIRPGASCNGCSAFFVR